MCARLGQGRHVQCAVMMVGSSMDCLCTAPSLPCIGARGLGIARWAEKGRDTEVHTRPAAARAPRLGFAPGWMGCLHQRYSKQLSRAAPCPTAVSPVAIPVLAHGGGGAVLLKFKGERAYGGQQSGQNKHSTQQEASAPPSVLCQSPGMTLGPSKAPHLGLDGGPGRGRVEQGVPFLLPPLAVVSAVRRKVRLVHSGGDQAVEPACMCMCRFACALHAWNAEHCASTQACAAFPAAHSPVVRQPPRLSPWAPHLTSQSGPPWWLSA